MSAAALSDCPGVPPLGGSQAGVKAGRDHAHQAEGLRRDGHPAPLDPAQSVGLERRGGGERVIERARFEPATAALRVDVEPL
jgi:hypothetical protein